MMKVIVHVEYNNMTEPMVKEWLASVMAGGGMDQLDAKSFLQGLTVTRKDQDPNSSAFTNTAWQLKPMEEQPEKPKLILTPNG
ncbi:hypothetical protein UFOVP558_34 [uncultured Caudovirales phage]|uniref:Uncharacterized protein n=1 Tax=uncultured Caudovirales phage TaxID=2100421 RepID=A0A6J5MUZ0_9CAUD|nr:hypothetical protein UFOVP558_34 [uncultured Caudovirales phage]